MAASCTVYVYTCFVGKWSSKPQPFPVQSYRTSSIAPSFTTTTTTQSPPQTRNTRSQSDAEAPNQDLSVSEVEDEMWQRELSELFSFSNSEQWANTNSRFGAYSNSAHCSLSKWYIVSLPHLTSLLSLIVSFALS